MLRKASCSTSSATSRWRTMRSARPNSLDEVLSYKAFSAESSCAAMRSRRYISSLSGVRVLMRRLCGMGQKSRWKFQGVCCGYATNRHLDAQPCLESRHHALASNGWLRTGGTRQGWRPRYCRVPPIRPALTMRRGAKTWWHAWPRSGAWQPRAADAARHRYHWAQMPTSPASTNARPMPSVRDRRSRNMRRETR